MQDVLIKLDKCVASIPKSVFEREVKTAMQLGCHNYRKWLNNLWIKSGRRHGILAYVDFNSENAERWFASIADRLEEQIKSENLHDAIIFEIKQMRRRSFESGVALRLKLATLLPIYKDYGAVNDLAKKLDLSRRMIHTFANSGSRLQSYILWGLWDGQLPEGDIEKSFKTAINTMPFRSATLVDSICCLDSDEEVFTLLSNPTIKRLVGKTKVPTMFSELPRLEKERLLRDVKTNVRPLSYFLGLCSASFATDDDDKEKDQDLQYLASQASIGAKEASNRLRQARKEFGFMKQNLKKIRKAEKGCNQSLDDLDIGNRVGRDLVALLSDIFAMKHLGIKLINDVCGIQLSDHEENSGSERWLL